MTRRRRIGEDGPFGQWIRSRGDLHSVVHGITVNDIDYTIHRYKDNVDGLGRRTVHLMVNIEAKTFGALPDNNQRQTLFFQHQRLEGKGPLVDAHDGSRKSVWHFGFYVLVMDGADPGPDDSTVRWCSFDDEGRLVPRTITVAHLARILRFDFRPDTLGKLDLRRHHATNKVVIVAPTPLGFERETIVERSS